MLKYTIKEIIDVNMKSNNSKRMSVLAAAIIFTSLIVVMLFYKSSISNDFAKLKHESTTPVKNSLLNNSISQIEHTKVSNNFENIKVKAIYISGYSAGNNKVLERTIKLIKDTELNAVVIDVKENGMVNYKSDNKLVNQYKTWRNVYNVNEVLNKFHENNIYVIGRIVCFRDKNLIAARKDYAIKMPNGSVWLENGIYPWANPYNENVWDYNIEIAKEAVSKGFDEILFDYVRFPTARESEISYGNITESKVDAICGFLEKAEKEIKSVRNIPVSADIFGIICISKVDGDSIGQDIEKIGQNIDYICPMVYPSHFANASKGMMGNGVGQNINGVNFTAPDLKPYEVVYNTLMAAKGKISKTTIYKAKIRPYLQDFTASYLKKGYYQDYNEAQVRAQVNAVKDVGIDEWIFWDAENTYTVGGFLKE